MIEVKKLYAAIEQENRDLAEKELENCIEAAVEKINTMLSGEKNAALPIIVAVMERSAQIFKSDFDPGDNLIYRAVKNSINAACTLEETTSQGGTL